MAPDVRAGDGAERCVETIGEPADPPILLVAGSGCSMDWWEDELCALLAARELRVLRYDHRDTGQSATSPPGAPAYTGAELTSDPIAILDEERLRAVAARAVDRTRRALAEAIPGARLMELGGVGHQYSPPEHWPRFVDALAAHTAGGAAR